MKRYLLALLLIACCACGIARGADPPQRITIDFAKPIGRLKPLNGVNHGPYYNGENAKLGRFHADAGFAYTRLHDVHWPCPDCVDVSTIFPIFDADADDSKYYVFAKTDDYLAAILKNKSQIVYRLGEDIEPWTHYHNKPPADFQQWAKVCVNIIRHYNDGWDNGFNYKISYWEIWNEPEIAHMWTGTRQQYLELYEVASKAIQAHDPSLKIGGPAATSIHSELVRQFLAFCRDRKLPLDFFSFHAYSGDPKSLAADAITARKLLDEYDFKQTQIHLNEWRYLPTWQGLRPTDPREFKNVPEWFARSCRAEGAAFCADVLIRMQDTPVDVMNFYCADTSPWSMFSQFGIPSKVYYTFKAFHALLACDNRVACIGLPAEGPICAAACVSDEKQSAALLLSNFKGPSTHLVVTLANLPWNGTVHVEVDQLDETHDLELTQQQTIDLKQPALELELPTNSVLLVRLSK